MVYLLKSLGKSGENIFLRFLRLGPGCDYNKSLKKTVGEVLLFCLVMANSVRTSAYFKVLGSLNEHIARTHLFSRLNSRQVRFDSQDRYKELIESKKFQIFECLHKFW